MALQKDARKDYDAVYADHTNVLQAEDLARIVDNPANHHVLGLKVVSVFQSETTIVNVPLPCDKRVVFEAIVRTQLTNIG